MFRSLFYSILITGFLGASAMAKTPTQLEGEQFIDTLADKAISSLIKSDLTVAQQKAQLQALLLENFDMQKIARFVLGRYWRVATPAQQQEFTQLFQQNIVEAYGDRLNEYQGQNVEVLDSRLSTNGKFILVNTKVEDNAGRDVIVEWRLQNNKPFKIADVSIEGVSMAATQRAQYAASIQRNGGTNQRAIEAFLQTLRRANPRQVVVQP